VRDKNGFALVITLIVTALLVAVTVEFIHDVFVETSLRHSYDDAQQASLVAAAGVSGAVRLIETTLAGQDYTSLTDAWAAPNELKDGRGSVRITISEESGKLDLNSIVFPNGMLNDAYYRSAQRLFRNLGLAGDALEAVADWVDSDDVQRPGGAETRFYKALEKPYSAKNGPLESYEELRMVAGFDDKALLKLSPCVTVYAESVGAPYSRINVNTAPAEVLAALDERMSSALVARLVEFRRTSPIRNPADITAIPGFETVGIALRDRIGVKGTVFRILSRARVNETVRLVEAVVRSTGTKSAILYWREL